jgi:hypothetical protein
MASVAALPHGVMRTRRQGGTVVTEANVVIMVPSPGAARAYG